MPLMSNGIQLDINAKNNASPVIKQVASDIGGLETSAQNAGDGVAGANTQMDTMIGTAKGLGAALTIVTTGVTAFVAAFEFGEIAAGNERLATSGELLANSYGESLDNILAKVSETSMGTVSDMDIITSANKAMMLGVGGSAEQLAQLMEIAAFRGRAMGISTTQAFDDMVRGIGRMSPMILDNLGIIVDAKTTYKAYAESIGKTAGELTRNEKIQALLNKVISEGNSMLAESGGLVEDNATSYERWNAELENTKNALLENTIGMSRLADMGATLLSSFTSATEDQNIVEFWFANATGVNVFNTALGFLEGRVANMNEETDKGSNARWEALASYWETATAVGELTGDTELSAEAAEAAQEAFEEFSKANAQIIDDAIAITERNEKYKDSQDSILAKIAEVREKKDSYYAWETDKIQAAQDDLDELGNKYFENRDKFVEAMQEKFALMAVEKIAMLDGVEGFSQAEFEKAQAILKTTSVATASAFEEQQAMEILTSAIATGVIPSVEDFGRILDQVTADGVVSVDEVRAALDGLPKNTDLNINVKVNSYQNEIGSYYSNLNKGNKKAKGTDGWEMVPPGYPNDSYPVMMQSGEHFAVIPAGVQASPASVGGFGGGGSTFVYAPTIGVSFGDEAEAKSRLYPWFLDMLEQAKANGHL